MDQCFKLRLRVMLRFCHKIASCKQDRVYDDFLVINIYLVLKNSLHLITKQKMVKKDNVFL